MSGWMTEARHLIPYFERDATQDAYVARASLHEAPRQSFGPVVCRLDARIRPPDLPWQNHGPRLPPSDERFPARRALHLCPDVRVGEPVGEKCDGRRWVRDA